MVDEEDAGPLRADVADAFAEPLALGGVEAGGGFVEQDDLGIGRAGPGDRDELALSLAAGRRPSRSRRSAMPTRSSARCTAPRRASPRDAERGGADVLLDAEVVVELELLERAGEAAAHALVRREAVDTGAVEAHRAARAFAKPVMASIALVLPAPLGPMRPTIPPGGTAQRDVVDGDHTAVAAP